MECRKQLCEKCKKKEDDYFLVTLYRERHKEAHGRMAAVGLFFIIRFILIFFVFLPRCSFRSRTGGRRATDILKRR